MGLMVEPWYFANYVDNLPTIPGTVYGTTVTPGTSSADGAVATLLSTLAFDVHYLVVGFTGFSASGVAHYCLSSLVIDPAGGTAWKQFIDYLVCGFTANQAALIPYTLFYHFPVFIKAGTSIGCKARTSHTVGPTSPRVVIYAYGNPSRPDAWWCGSGVETLGVIPASSTGTSITPGNTGAFGTWATMGTSSARYGALQWGLNGTDSIAENLQYYFQVGYNNMPIPAVPTMSAVTNASEYSLYSYLYGPNWVDIPSGTDFKIRGTCSGTAEIFAGGGAVYGVY